jgi:hypothetical protein
MFKLSMVKEVDWPVTVTIPQDGGAVMKATFTARFRLITQAEADESPNGAATRSRRCWSAGRRAASRMRRATRSPSRPRRARSCSIFPTCAQRSGRPISRRNPVVRPQEKTSGRRASLGDAARSRGGRGVQVGRARGGRAREARREALGHRRGARSAPAGRVRPGVRALAGEPRELRDLLRARHAVGIRRPRGRPSAAHLLGGDRLHA